MTDIQKFTVYTPPLDSTCKAHLGEWRWIDGNRYEYCIFTEDGAGGATLTAGDAVFSNLLTTSDYHVNWFEAAGAATISDLRGIFIGDGNAPDQIDDTTIVSGDYGWIQTYGYQASILQDGTTDIAAGDSLKGVSGQHHLIQDAARGTTPSYHNYVIAKDAYTTNSASLQEGYIRCGN